MGLGPARAWSRVVVDGAGSLVRDVADDLRTGGVGQVTGGIFALDAELRLEEADPDLVVLLVGGPLRPGTAAALQARGIPHLPVVTEDLEVVVGPLVLPGRSACLTCLDLTRGRTRPVPVRGARAARGGRSGPPDELPIGPSVPAVVDPALRALTRATVAMTVCAALADQCPPGVSLELSLPWPRPVQRVWTPHPWCGCGAPGARADDLGREWTA